MAMRSHTIVLTGGGSGGHITPLMAVAHQLKVQNPRVRIVYIGTRGDRLGDIAAKHADIDQAHAIFAGKFRRYHTEGWLQFLNLKTLFFNVRDFFFVGIGCLQSFVLLMRLQPDCIFIKGGFVGVPVGLAATLLRRTFVTHDSDAIPGLANRIVGRWAALHATGMPANLYPYPPEKTVYTGVPVQAGFTAVSSREQSAFRKELGLPEKSRVLFVTGGGLGALRLNNAIARIAPRLLQQYADLTIIQAAGHANYSDLIGQYEKLDTDVRQRIIVKDFIANLHVYSGAADVVVMRASATSMAEMAVQGKACILVPNPLLTGGHQTKNAAAFAHEDAARVVTESADESQNSKALYEAITLLFDDAAERNTLALNIAKFAAPDAAAQLATMLLRSGGLV